jgi:hypothetical protein
MVIESKMITSKGKRKLKCWTEDDPWWKKCFLWCFGYRKPWTIECAQEITCVWSESAEQYLKDMIAKEMENKK